jgi:hypothetical protein
VAGGKVTMSDDRLLTDDQLPTSVLLKLVNKVIDADELNDTLIAQDAKTVKLKDAECDYALMKLRNEYETVVIHAAIKAEREQIVKEIIDRIERLHLINEGTMAWGSWTEYKDELQQFKKE